MDMQTLLLTINALALAALLWRQSRQRAELHTLQSHCEQLRVGMQTLPADAQALLGPERPLLLSIEILNPMQVAATQSWFASTFGSLTPGLVRRVVYERAVGIVRQEVLKHGLEAEVRLHRA
jgi:hypothetical protein